MASKLKTDYICSLKPEVLEKAKKELNEDPDTRHIEVKNLAKRLENIPGLKPRLDTPFLLKFLRARKFAQEAACALVCSYYQIRIDQPDMFEDIKPSRVRHIIDAGAIDVLNGRDLNGCALMVIRPGRWDPERYPIIDLFKSMYLTLCLLLEDEETQVYGVHIINNTEGLTMKQASQIGPGTAKKLTSILQNVVPMRFKRLDYVNEPSFFDMLFAIIRPFLKEKLVNRLHMNGSKIENLQETVSVDILPTDLGGKAEPFSNKLWKETFLASDSKFDEDNKFGFVKMDVRQGSKNGKGEDSDMVGLGGTFKKLDV